MFLFLILRIPVFWTSESLSVTTICKPISLINILRISGGGAVRTDFSETSHAIIIMVGLRISGELLPEFVVM